MEFAITYLNQVSAISVNEANICYKLSQSFHGSVKKTWCTFGCLNLMKQSPKSKSNHNSHPHPSTSENSVEVSGDPKFHDFLKKVEVGRRKSGYESHTDGSSSLECGERGVGEVVHI